MAMVYLFALHDLQLFFHSLALKHLAPKAFKVLTDLITAPLSSAKRIHNIEQQEKCFSLFTLILCIFFFVLPRCHM